VAAYGSAKDLWGTALSPADIMNAGFGVVIAAQNGMTALGTVTSPPQQAPSQPATPATQPPIAVPAPAPIPAIPGNNQKLASMISRITALPTPIGRASRGKNVRALQQILIDWNIGSEIPELKRWGPTGFYKWRTERSVAELQEMLMRAAKGPAARALIDAFKRYGYGKGTFGPATKAAAIEYLSL
jgi:hypothetical protein